MNVNVNKISRFLDAAKSAVDHLRTPEIDLPWDAYWLVIGPQQYAIDENPTQAVGLGRLHDDVETLNAHLNAETDWGSDEMLALAGLLRALGEYWGDIQVLEVDARLATD